MKTVHEGVAVSIISSVVVSARFWFGFSVLCYLYFVTPDKSIRSPKYWQFPFYPSLAILSDMCTLFIRFVTDNDSISGWLIS